MGFIKVKKRDLILNTPFNYSFFLKENFNNLRTSIKKFGVLTPVFVFKRDGNIIPFTGFKRIFFSENEIPILFFERNKDIDYFKLAITENISHRDLNLIEISNLLQNILSLGYEKNIIYSEIYPIIGLNPNKIDLDFMFSVNLLPLDCKKYIASGKFSIKALRILLKFPENLRGDLFMFSKNMRFNTNQEMKFFRYIFNLWKKGEKIEDIIREFGELNSKKISLPQKAEKVLEQLESKDFPLQYQYKNKFFDFLDRFNYPSSLKVFYPNSFEEKKIKMELEVTPDNLRDIIVFFKNLEDNNFFERLDELI